MLVIIIAMCGRSIPSAFAEEIVDFEKTYVLDDLTSSEDFNILTYPFYESIEPTVKIINVVEYCYSFKESVSQNYGLYLYIYNPNALNILKEDNFVQMAVAYNEDNTPSAYEKFTLKYCSKTEESEYSGLFYKFKVVDKQGLDGKTVKERVNSNGRRYDISGLELNVDGESMDFLIGGTYVFTGYAKGCGPDESAESNLTCEVKELETITLETTSTLYRTGQYTQYVSHDLTSVYFAVPEKYFLTYGGLQKIKADWYEYVTTPMVITSNTEVKNGLTPWIGKSIGRVNDNVPLSLYTGFKEENTGGGHYYRYDWVYNAVGGAYQVGVANTYCERLNWLFYTGGTSVSGFALGADKIEDYAKNYTLSFDKGYLSIPGKKISADLFENNLSASRAAVSYLDNDIHHKQVNFDAGEAFDMLNYDESNAGWVKFFEGLFGFRPSETDVSYKGISPIKVVSASDMAQTDIAKHLLIDGSATSLNAFKSFYNQAVKDEKRVVLLRFAQTDYTALPVIAYNNHTGTNLSKDYGKDTYVVQESVFYNFDILELTFNKQGKYTVIPVVHTPLDVYNDVTLPIEDNDGQGFKNVLVLILGIVLLVVILYFCPPIFDVLLWLVCLPFKLIAKLIKVIMKRG